MTESEQKDTPVNYNSYLKVPELTQLQQCLSSPEHHDEPLFIIIHQTYELWFKLILHELDHIAAHLQQGNIRRANFFVRRVVAILRILAQQIYILETMAPKDFLGFRNSLAPASGFQSSQFREIEFFCGLKSEHMLKHFANDPVTFERLKARFAAPSLADLLYQEISKHGFALPQEELSDSPKVKEEKQLLRLKELVRLYEAENEFASLIDLCESLLDLDEQLFLWRTNHVTVVERMIGFKQGTGGSEGVGYLRQTLSKKCFPDLWNLRTMLETPEAGNKTW